MPSNAKAATPHPLPVAPASPRRRGPRPKGESEELRARVLDSAEELFAEHGFHGTSIRDIAGMAGVQLALVGYHFGSKEDLLDHVLARRASVLHAERMQALADARARHGTGHVPVKELFDGYAACFLARASRGDAGWRNYATLVASLANSSPWGTLVSKHYDDAARSYLKELERTCSGTDPEIIYRGFFFMIAIMVAVCSRPGRIERLSLERFDSSDISRLAQSVSLFVEGGFLALTKSTAPKKSRRSGGQSSDNPR